MGISRMVARQLKRLLELRNLLIVNFLCLFLNLFFFVMQLNHGFWPVETFFQPVLVGDDKQVMMDTMKTFTATLDAANLTYFLYAGSLIGTYRHHGPIPWDDDIDVMLNASQKTQVRDALWALRPEYDIYIYNEDISQPSQWKFYSNAQGGFIHRPFKWPYIDVFFFQENETHIWDEVPRFSDKYRFPKEQVFPLERRPFAELMVPAPCATKAVLDTNYQIQLCRARSFSHMMEMPLFSFTSKDVPCSRLEHMFPFVSRTYVDGVMNETLRIGDWVLQSHVLPSYCKGRHP